MRGLRLYAVIFFGLSVFFTFSLFLTEFYGIFGEIKHYLQKSRSINKKKSGLKENFQAIIVR